jgi:TPR repeat protein
LVILIHKIHFFNITINRFEKAADQGNSEAQAELGRYYQFNKGNEKDMKKAVFW